MGTPKPPPARRVRSASGRRRSVSAARLHHSATDSALPVPAVGTFATLMPLAVAAAISTPSRPAPHCWTSFSPRTAFMSSPSTLAMAGMRTSALVPRRSTSGSTASTRTPGSASPRNVREGEAGPGDDEAEGHRSEE
jgi:hypothetical protein